MGVARSDIGTLKNSTLVQGWETGSAERGKAQSGAAGSSCVSPCTTTEKITIT